LEEKAMSVGGFEKALNKQAKTKREIWDEPDLHRQKPSFWKLLFQVFGNGEFEVVYFSGEKIVHFAGKLSEEQIKCLEHTAWKVSEITIDEVNGEVKETLRQERGEWKQKLQEIQPTLVNVIRVLRNFATICKTLDVIESGDFKDLTKWADELEKFGELLKP
jgi:hypothetical protein